MRPDNCTGALPVEVEIAHLELAARPLQLLARGRIDGAGETKLSVVGDLQGVLKITGLYNRKHRSEDFLLCDPGRRRNIGKHRRLYVVASSAFGNWSSSGNQSTFLLTDLDVAQHFFELFLAHYLPHSFVLRRVAHTNLVDAFFQTFQEYVVDLLVNNGSRARRAFLAGESKSRLCNALHGRVQVGIVSHNDGVFAAHLQNCAFDPLLAGARHRRSLVDVQSHLFGPGKSNEADLRMLDQAAAESRAGARTEIHDPIGHPGLLQCLEKLCGDDG